MNNTTNLPLFHIPEPKLTFGYNQKVVDPRDGLTLFGPFERDKFSGQINIGIIGPPQQRRAVKEYLQAIHKPIVSEETDVARPYFPGLEAAFGIFINFTNLKEIDVPKEEIDRFMNYSDPHERIYNFCNLYSNRLISYPSQEEVPITVWFVAIPDDIYRFGRPNFRIPFVATNIKAGLGVEDRQSEEKLLFQELNQLKEVYTFKPNFHNQLKAKLLRDKIVTQVIRESTIRYRELWTNEKRIQAEKKFDTAKAWNIATTLYYKMGGLPWRLGDVRQGVCYVGLVYKKVQESEDETNACCAAQMFLNSGDGVVFKGHVGPWYNPESKEFHIKKSDAVDLLSQALESFKNRSGTNSYPNEVFIHAKTYFNDDEWSGFEEAAEGKSSLIGVRIRDTVPLKLYREFDYCVPRGTVLQLSQFKAHLWTKGFIARLQTQLGLEIPNSLEIEVTRGSIEIKVVCTDILALTKLNYNSCIYGDGLPVTLRFADQIGEVLTAGRDVESGVLPFKHYV